MTTIYCNDSFNETSPRRLTTASNNTWSKMTGTVKSWSRTVKVKDKVKYKENTKVGGRCMGHIDPVRMYDFQNWIQN